MKITLIVFEEATNNTTLFGTDLINDVGVCLNFAQRTWCFADKPQDTFSLEQEIMATVFTGTSRISDLTAEEEPGPCKHQR